MSPFFDTELGIHDLTCAVPLIDSKKVLRVLRAMPILLTPTLGFLGPKSTERLEKNKTEHGRSGR
jgi:hypothetical protein